eukprot:84686_1
MPCYNLLLVAAPRAPKSELLTTFRKIGREIVDRGGVIRGFKHLGIRRLPQKMRRHGLICNEARFIEMKTDCSSEARSLVDTILKDELKILRWDMSKVKLLPHKRMKYKQLNHIMEHSHPVINDPVFDFPKKAEMRRLKYNAKRKALDQNSKENIY